QSGLGPGDLAPQHRHLMPEHHDLGVLWTPVCGPAIAASRRPGSRSSRADEEPRPAILTQPDHPAKPQVTATASSSEAVQACRAAGVAQASWYRRHRASPAPPRPAPVPHRARVLSPAEQTAILDALHAERFADLAPAEVWAILLDEGTYLGSLSTFYRLLRAAGETPERRRQAPHPAAVKPELAAAGPNQVYSWDITKLHGPAKWAYYHLYVILDIYSRYAVGWMVATRESAALAEKLIAETCSQQGITRGQLSVHADRGSSMTSKPVALLLADLGVTQSHSRPHVSNDNPYSEAQFKT